MRSGRAIDPSSESCPTCQGLRADLTPYLDPLSLSDPLSLFSPYSLIPSRRQCWRRHSAPPMGGTSDKFDGGYRTSISLASAHGPRPISGNVGRGSLTRHLKDCQKLKDPISPMKLGMEVWRIIIPEIQPDNNPKK